MISQFVVSVESLGIQSRHRTGSCPQRTTAFWLRPQVPPSRLLLPGSRASPASSTRQIPTRTGSNRKKNSSSNNRMEWLPRLRKGRNRGRTTMTSSTKNVFLLRASCSAPATNTSMTSRRTRRTEAIPRARTPRSLPSSPNSSMDRLPSPVRRRSSRSLEVVIRQKATNLLDCWKSWLEN